MFNKIVGFPHRPETIGGPGTFQIRLTEELIRKGYRIVFSDDKRIPDVICVVGGTRYLNWIRQCKKKGTKVVHRLDGINWRHRIKPLRLHNFIVAEMRNFIISYIRNHLADFVIYQSKFIQNWWHDKFGAESCKYQIIYNGTDLSLFMPSKINLGKNENRLVVVEGNVQSDHASLLTLIGLSKELTKRKIIKETMVYGGVEPRLESILSNEDSIKYAGKENRKNMPDAYRSGTAFLCLEINPPCPNSVIEALASGLPVVGYDTGSLNELVTKKAGRFANYGSNPWLLETPDLGTLVQEAIELFNHQDEYSKAARAIAEERFSHKKMALNYINVFEKTV